MNSKSSSKPIVPLPSVSSVLKSPMSTYVHVHVYGPMSTYVHVHVHVRACMYMGP